jgi:hypothetical protein
MHIFQRRHELRGDRRHNLVTPRRRVASEREQQDDAGTERPEPVVDGGMPERRRSMWRPREARAAAARTVASGVMGIARLLLSIAGVIALLIALAVVLRDVDANARNTIVKGIHEGANFFAGAFTGIITFRGHPKREITLDWGIAIVVYLIVGALIARSIARLARGSLRYERSHRVAS